MKRQVWPFLMGRLRRRWPALGVLTAANLGTALLAVQFALGSKNVIDSAVNGPEAAFWRACLVQGGIIAGLLLCLFVARWLNSRLHDEMDRDWKKSLFHSLLQGDYNAVSAFHSGELVNRLTNDVRIVNDGILNTLPNLTSMAVRLVSVVVVMASLAPWFTLAAVVFAAVVALVTGLVRRYVRDLHKNVSAANGRVSGFMQEILEKLLLVQAMDVAGEVEKRGDGLMQERWSIQRKKRAFSLTASTCVSLLTYGSGFAALVFCGYEVHRGTMSFGELTAMTQLVAQLQAPMVNLSGVIPQVMAMMASAERLMELEEGIFAAEEGTRTEADLKALYAGMKSLGAEKLSFSYDREQILEESSFCLPKGSFAVIVGPSGIGKSTLLKLLLGIFPPDSGSLYIDCGSQRIPLDRSTRKLFAYVPQGNLLLSGTVRENLILVRPEATEEEIQQAVYVSAMDRFLPELPQGLDTHLGENGAGLSEGQAQRLSIARAVLGAAPILLLDECTSALDEETERTVLSRLRELKDRSCLAVTHRPAAVTQKDCRLEVKDGKIRRV